MATGGPLLGDPLPGPPDDGITRLLWSPGTRRLLASSWDHALRLYDVTSRACVGTFRQRSPILDAAHPEDGTAFCGLLTGEIRRVMLPGGQDVTMGMHEQGVRCLEWVPSRGFLVSGSWDQTLKVWDPRSMQPLVRVVPLPGRVFSMSAAGDHLVVGLSQRLVLIFDVRKLEFGQPEQQRESSLKYMTRSVAAYPNGAGYALGSVEGRVAMEFYDMRPEVQQAKYAFKCHRRTVADTSGPDPSVTREIIYPVHAITYHGPYGTFATGGGDGVVNIWDGDNKKRLFQIARYPTSVSSLAFSPDGQSLAVGCSYCWEEGEKPDHPHPSIYIRPMSDAEVRPKSRPLQGAPGTGQ